MNLQIITKGGGIFSHFMTAIQSIESKISNLDSIESIYIKPNTNSTLGLKSNGLINPFDFVLEQKNEIHDYNIDASGMGSYTNHDDIPLQTIDRLKTIASKIKIKNEILNKINADINKNTLGVHIRITDMAYYHPEYTLGQTISTDNFLKKTYELISSNDNIFVASDNTESLNQFKNKFKIISNNCNNRCQCEVSENYCDYQINNFNQKSFWIDSFLDMISLSKCGSFIYNVSNLNNAAFIFSQTTIKTYKI